MKILMPDARILGRAIRLIHEISFVSRTARQIRKYVGLLLCFVSTFSLTGGDFAVLHFRLVRL
jgi:hypothetical protein